MTKIGFKPRRRQSRGSADEAVLHAKDNSGLNPVPKSNLLLADIALRGGGKLLRLGVDRGLLGVQDSTKKAAKALTKRSLSQTLVGAVVTRLATRSVPGAIIIGGGMLAKMIHERRKLRKAGSKGESSGKHKIADDDDSLQS